MTMIELFAQAAQDAAQDVAQNTGVLESIENFVTDHAFNVLLIIGISYIGRKFAMVFIGKLIRRAIVSNGYKTHRDEEQREDTLISTIGAIVRAAIWIVSGMLLLAEMGIDTGPLVASVGIVGVALGFGAQSLVKDFIAGVFILTENQYRVGDVVELNQTVIGSVESFNLRTTVLRDLDGMQHHMPNGEISIATNMTMDYANINLDIGVGYDTDIDKLELLINTVGSELGQDDDWKDKIKQSPSFLRVNNFADSAIEVKITGRTEPRHQWAVTGELRRRLKKAFDKNGIEIPFPQRVIHQQKVR